MIFISHVVDCNTQLIIYIYIVDDHFRCLRRGTGLCLAALCVSGEKTVWPAIEA